MADMADMARDTTKEKDSTKERAAAEDTGMLVVVDITVTIKFT